MNYISVNPRDESIYHVYNPRYGWSATNLIFWVGTDTKDSRQLLPRQQAKAFSRKPVVSTKDGLCFVCRTHSDGQIFYKIPDSEHNHLQKTDLETVIFLLGIVY